MEATVRDASAETLRLCRERGHDVSPAVAAVFVQAQRLAKVHPNDLVQHCVARLSKKGNGDPALCTLKMQLDVLATRAKRAQSALTLRRARDLKAGDLEREVSDTVVDPATCSGRDERLLLDKLHQSAFSYVFVTAGLANVLATDFDDAARNDAYAAFESVFPRHGARRFFTLPSTERQEALRELASVVVGALVFARRRDGENGENGNGASETTNGAQRWSQTTTEAYDPFLDENTLSTASANPFFTKDPTTDSLAKLRDQTPLFFTEVAKTKTDLRLKLNSAERLCAQYAVVVEHLGCVSTPSGDGTVRVVTDELNNRMVFADALRGLLEESDKGEAAVGALNDSLNAEVSATETALDNANGGPSVSFADITGLTAATRGDSRTAGAPRGAFAHTGRKEDGVGSGGVPASVAFPALDAMGALHVAIEEEILALLDVRAVFKTLMEHAQPFKTSLTNGMLHAATQACRVANAREVPMPQPKFEQDRHTPDRVFDDDLCRAMAIKESAEIVPGNTVNFHDLQLGGYDAHALVKRGGLLRKARAGYGSAAKTVWGDKNHDPETTLPDVTTYANTAVIFESKAYGFADEDGALQFASQPGVYLKKLTRVACVRPELLCAVQCFETVNVSNVIAETTAELMQHAVAVNLHPVTACDFGAQTPVHFTEKNMDPSYEWNVWAIKRRALRMANLLEKKTKSAQTSLSHFRRAGQTQTWAPKTGSSQTLVEKATAMPKTIRYVSGLRGAPHEAKMHVMSLKLDLGQPHEF